MLEIRTTPLHPGEWLGVIDREYFTDYLCAGGAAAKFVVGDDAAREEVESESVTLARRHGLLHARLSAGETKLHMAQEMFFALARALPWDGLLQRYLEELFARHEHSWPRPGTAMNTTELAEAFDIAPGIMARHRDQWLSRDLWDDPRLARDFRAAMIALCLSRLDPRDDGDEVNTPVHQWLRGDKPPLASLREFDITAANQLRQRTRHVDFAVSFPAEGGRGRTVADHRPARRHPHRRFSGSLHTRGGDGFVRSPARTDRRPGASARPVHSTSRIKASSSATAGGPSTLTRLWRCESGPMCGPGTGRIRWRPW